jgi:hypothetical protein
MDFSKTGSEKVNQWLHGYVPAGSEGQSPLEFQEECRSGQTHKTHIRKHVVESWCNFGLQQLPDIGQCRCSQ